MDKKTKLSIALIIFFLVLILASFLCARHWTKQFREYLNVQGASEYAKVNDVVITETKNEIKEWELYAANAEYNTNRTIVTLKDIVGNYYQNNEVVLSFTSPYGTYNTETKEIQLYDSVRFVGKDDVELTANKVTWVMSSDKVNAEGNVIINKANEIIALSDKAALKTDFSQFEIINNTEIRVYKNLNNRRGK